MRCGIARWALVLPAVLGAWPAGAVSLVAELTGARPFTSLALMAELELWEDRTFLSGCFASTRSAPLELTGTGDAIDIPRSNQLCLGLDHGLDNHFRLSASASLAPRAITRVDLLSSPLLVFRSENASAGVTLGASYDSAGLEEVQWGVDVGLSLTGYDLSHEWITALRTRRFPAVLGTARPSAGVIWAFGDTQLQLRASYTFYSKDPLVVGAVSDQELLALDEILRRLIQASQIYGLNEQYAAFLGAANRLMAADAVSGLASAPVWFEVRPSVQHRFAGWLRGQLGYSFDRYVPTQGYAHLLSTRWTVIFSDHVRTWVAAAAQLDVPGSMRPKLQGILTFGVEVTF